MSYKSALDTLREQVFTESPVLESVKKGNFIPRKQPESNVVAKTENVLDMSRSWIQQVRSASQEVRATTKDKLKNVGGGFGEGFANTFNPKKKEEEIVEEGPSKKEAFVQRRSSTSPSTYSPKRESENKAVKTFKDAIDKTEGGGNYDTLFGHSQRDSRKFSGTKVSQMSIGEIKNFARGNGEYGQWVKAELGRIGQEPRVATPMGRYQFVGSTLTKLASEMGLSDDTVFSPDVQDQMFEFYLKKRLARGNTMDEKVAQVRGAWEGFKSLPKQTLVQLISQYEA